MTKVIFRKCKEGDIIALFPEELNNPSDYSIVSYMHVGQHGGADYEHIIQTTAPATESKYADLLAELKSIGYDDLRVIRRCRPNYSMLIADYKAQRFCLTND